VKLCQKPRVIEKMTKSSNGAIVRAISDTKSETTIRSTNVLIHPEDQAGCDMYVTLYIEMHNHLCLQLHLHICINE